jgi:hypothetical protein
MRVNLGQKPLRCGLGIRSRFEDWTVEEQRAFEPAPQCDIRSPSGTARRLIEQLAQTVGILVCSHAPSQQKRQSHEGELKEVRAAVESRGTGPARRRDQYPELRKAIRRELEALQCRSEDVFDDDQTSFGRDHDAIGAQCGVDDATVLGVKRGECRRQLADKRCGEPGSTGFAEDFGKSLSGREVRDERQPVAVAEVLDRPHAGERVMPEVAQTAHALAQRDLESRSGRQIRPEAQQLERRRAAVVEHEQAIAEAVGQAL